MQCTREEIEEKRKQAIEKLARKKLETISPLKASNERQSVNTGSTASRESPSNNKLKAGGQWKNKLPSHSAKPYDKPVLQFNGKKTTTAKFVLQSDERFAVELTQFDTIVIDVFKTISSRNYDIKSRTWDFHIKDHDVLFGKLKALQPNVTVEKLPPFVLNCVKQPKPDYSSINLGKLDPELNATLLPFQQEGVCFGIEKRGRCLIADDMGLGKTFQALGIADYYREDWPMLIVTTASMKNVWEETIHRFLPTVSVLDIQFLTSCRDFIDDSRIIILSHDMMTRSAEKLLEKQFGVLIVDESHNFKNFKAKGTKVVIQLAKKAKRVILLSGTPALSRPSELYTQLSLIDEKFFFNFFEYSKRYCDGKTTQFGWDASGQSNLQELEVILSKKFMIRRTKENVLQALPNKVQEVVTLNIDLSLFSEEDRKVLSSLAAKYNDEKRAIQKHSVLLTFFSETAKIKIPSVVSYVLQVLEENKKFLIFAHHQIMLDAICSILQKKNKKFIRIDGNTNSDQRKFFVDKFQLDDRYRVAVLSITAANAGITLTAADLVLFAELHWNPSILSQAESRAHRIGQQNLVKVKFLLAPGTADDSIWPLLQKKQKVLSDAGLSKDNFSDVNVTKQNVDTDGLTNGLLSVTSANTLDISNYFTSPEKRAKACDNKNDYNKDDDIFNDGLDDILCNIDV